MKVADFTTLAKKAQLKLRELDLPAEHIYLLGYSDPRSIPSLLFVSNKYDDLDLYDKARISTLIQNGALKFNFYVVGPLSFRNGSSTIRREHLYKAIKIYGKKPLTLGNMEFASKKDLEFAQATT